MFCFQTGGSIIGCAYKWVGAHKQHFTVVYVIDVNKS